MKISEFHTQRKVIPVKQESEFNYLHSFLVVLLLSSVGLFLQNFVRLPVVSP